MTKADFCKKLNSLKRREFKVQEELNAFLSQLGNDGVDMEAPSNAENSDTIEEAITCYVGYGEYIPSKIWEEIEKQKGGA